MVGDLLGEDIYQLRPALFSRFICCRAFCTRFSRAAALMASLLPLPVTCTAVPSQITTDVRCGREQERDKLAHVPLGFLTALIPA